MTNKEAIEFLKNMIGEKSASTIGKEGFFVELMEYHIEALNLAIKALKIDCEACVYKDYFDDNAGVLGHWIKDEEHSITIDMFKCSVCSSYGHTHFRFCSNCGADMRECEND